MSDQYQPPHSDLTTEGSFDGIRLFSARGRLGRIRYLAHSFWVTSVIYIAGFLMISGAEVVSELLSYVAALIMFVVLITVTFIFTIKRSHDFNASGWWSLLALVPLANLFFVFKSGTPTTNRYGSVPPPNTVLLWIGGMAAPVLFFIGLLAAITIPAYQDYTSRAQVGQSIISTHASRTALAKFYQEHDRWPHKNELFTLNLDKPIETEFSLIYAYPETGIVKVVMLDSPNVNESVANGSMIFTPNFAHDPLTFDCTSDNISQRFLGSRCQGADDESDY